MGYKKADFFMIVLLTFIFFISMFIVLKPTNFLSIASEEVKVQSK